MKTEVMLDSNVKTLKDQTKPLSLSTTASIQTPYIKVVLSHKVLFDLPPSFSDQAAFYLILLDEKLPEEFLLWSPPSYII